MLQLLMLSQAWKTKGLIPSATEMFRQEIDLGLTRVLKLLDALGSPHRILAPKVIHVAGTNGKGSTCGFLSSILVEAGYKVGRFTSPHLIEPRDCICIDGEVISSAEWEHLNSDVEKTSRRISADETQFERLTAVALLCFVRNRVDYAVIEVGLGGRLDATNVFAPHRLLTIMTSISEDHMNFFGETVDKIAHAEAEILSDDDCIVAVQSEKEAEIRLMQRAQLTGGTYEFITSPTLILNSSSERNECELSRKTEHIRIEIPLLGDFQRLNVATAVWAAWRLREKGLEKISNQVIVRGIAHTRWPGRLEWTTISNSLLPPASIHPTEASRWRMLIDGAHNKSGARELRVFIDSQMKREGLKHVQFIFGAAAHKDLRAILSELLRPGDSLCAVPFPTPEGMGWIRCQQTDQILKAVHDLFPLIHSSSAHSWHEAVKTLLAEQRTNVNDSLLVLTGSLYLISHYYRTKDELK